MVIVLASGKGERYTASGGSGNKLDADLAGKSVLQRCLESVQATGLLFWVERAEHAGMGDAIAAAIRSHPHPHGWLILPGDLACIQPQTLLEIATAQLPNGVIIPQYHGQRGHPVRFHATYFSALSELQGARGAATCISAHDIHSFVTGDRGTVLDIDTQTDLATACEYLRQFGG